MSSKQISSVKAGKKYRAYSQVALTDAYNAVKTENVSVCRASKTFGVPEQTLRDRVKGIIHVDCVTTGRSPVLSMEEEAKLVNHLKSVANYGYGYSRMEVVDLATDYGILLRKRTKENPFTLNWFVKFIKRWPELRVLKPRALEVSRAKCTSEAVVSNYFNELENILDKYNLKTKPHLIYNVDEKGISQNHTPPHIVGTVYNHPQAVTAGKSQTTTIIGCGSASGSAIPPFFVFAGKRMMPELMKNASPGANCAMSETGWSNSEIFRKYLKEHFLKFIPRREPDEHLLLLLDGHKSHISIDLVEWAKTQNIILFILPAHTSHVLQPMDVACYGPFQKMFNNFCHKHTRQTSSVTRYDICGLACSAYNKALSCDNLISAFNKTGIYPLDRSVISEISVLPAEVFVSEDNQNNITDVLSVPENQDIENDLNQNVNENNNEHEIHNDDSTPISVISPSAFMGEKLKKLKTVKSEKKSAVRNTVGKIVSGKPITESDVQKKLIDHQCTQTKSATCTNSTVTKRKIKSNKGNVCKKKKAEYADDIPSSQQPGPLDLHVPSSFDSSDDETAEDDKCCVCSLFTPEEVRKSISLIITKWVKCDRCPHWVHLGFCTKTRVIRRGDEFICPHCTLV